jgi:hypothetical protein
VLPPRCGFTPAATRPATRRAVRQVTLEPALEPAAEVAAQTAAQTPPGGDNGAADLFWRCMQAGNPTATQCGPGCHSGSAKYARSVQQPHGDGRSRGTTGWKSDRRGADFHEGGHRGGTTGEANRCAGPERRRTEISGGTDRPDRRTFRSLKLLVLPVPPISTVREPFRTGLSAHIRRTFGTPGTTPRRPSRPRRHADLGGLVGPSARPSVGPFCRSVPQLSD